MFLALFISEMVEEMIEEVIATTITWLIGRIISVLFVILLTQGTKAIGKGLYRVIKRVVKSITYKEGNDKMTKIKNFFAKAKKVLTENVIFANKLTISGWISVIVMSLEGTDIINVINVLPEVSVFGFNVMPYLYIGVLALLSIFGIGKEGLESVKTYLARIKERDANKEAKANEIAKQKEVKKIAKEKLKAHNADLKQRALTAAEEEYQRKLNEEVK